MGGSAVSKVVGIVLNGGHPRARELALEVVSQLEEAGVRVRVPSVEAAVLDRQDLGVSIEDFAQGLSFAISLGGDGTMLRAIDLVSSGSAAVLGVNIGQLGYLTEVEPADLAPALKRVLEGDFYISERMLVDVAIEQAGVSGVQHKLALNEAVLEKTHSGRLVRVGVWINGTFFTTYAADGVIVATPTGSTAYSFSARGPIVSPAHHCLVVTPVSPHMLFDRALVLGSNEEIRLEVSDERDIDLIIDGREVCRLGPGDSVTCTGASQPARIITFAPRDFHQVLKTKFGLPS